MKKQKVIKHVDPLNGEKIAIRSVVYPEKSLLAGGVYNPINRLSKPSKYADKHKAFRKGNSAFTRGGWRG